MLILTWLNLTRLILALQQWGFLRELLPFSPLYQAATGLVWSVAGAVLLWGLWRGASWAPDYTRVGSLIFVLYKGLEWLLLVKNPGKTTNLPFNLVVHLLVLAIIFWIFSRGSVRAFFGERHDRKQKDPGTA